MSTVNVSFYLIVGQEFTAGGFKTGRSSVRVAKTKPSCGPNEVAMKLAVDLPESLFKRPQLSATITVPESQAPMVITPEIEQNIARVVQEQLGITMRVSSTPAENEGEPT